MGHPSYEVTSGEIKITSPQSSPQGEEDIMLDLLEMEPNERSQAGVFLSFQNIPEIKGVKLSEYLRTIFNISQEQKTKEFQGLSPFMFRRYVKPLLQELHIEESFLDRDLNV